MDIATIEQASRHAWPALEEQELPFGLLRYAAGVNRRSNSMNPFPCAQVGLDELVRTTESFFRERQQASIVRVLSGIEIKGSLFPELDKYLDCSGYEMQARTRVMTLELQSFSTTANCERMLSARSLDANAWLENWLALKQESSAVLTVYREVFSRIKDPVRYLMLEDAAGNPVAVGMAVKHRDSLGIFGIVTSLARRARGYGTEVMNCLLRWGSANGARYAYLQVEEVNSAAVGLYGKLGFAESYSYWYRVKQY